MGKATSPRKPKLSIVRPPSEVNQNITDLLSEPPFDLPDEQERIELERAMSLEERLCTKHWNTMEERARLSAKADAANDGPVCSPSMDIELPDCVVPFSGVPEDHNPSDDDEFRSIRDIIDSMKIKPGPSWEERDPTKPGSDQEFRVALMRDHKLDYPDLWMKIFVAGSRSEEAQFAEMFTRAACSRAESLEKADLCVFTGGPDVDPQMYGEKPHYLTSCNEARDTADINLYLFCMEHGIPMLGICRGAQFLHVMNGGKLYQDVDRHNGDHTMWDVVGQRQIERVSSVHHQMCIQNTAGGMQLLGTSGEATKRWKNPLFSDDGHQADVEAFFYRDTCCLGIQGHPEYRGYNYFAKWTLQQIENYVVLNPDVDWIKGFRRIKPEIMAQRGNGPIIYKPKTSAVFTPNEKEK
jgi:gamma-glutamyl-gamma-aminobutyrate hydrolase PuuD